MLRKSPLKCLKRGWSETRPPAQTNDAKIHRCRMVMFASWASEKELRLNAQNTTLTICGVGRTYMDRTRRECEIRLASSCVPYLLVRVAQREWNPADVDRMRCDCEIRVSLFHVEVVLSFRFLCSIQMKTLTSFILPCVIWQALVSGMCPDQVLRLDP